MKSNMPIYFAAANTENGFYSLFDEIFSPEALSRIYILKGGPGSGKSTLIGDVGAAGEKRGYAVEYFACSSDTASLDGVLLPALGAAVIDGTSPHMTDPRYPGAVERIVNLFDAFDMAGMAEKRDSIVSKIRSKKDLYHTAYRYLFAAGHIHKEVSELARAAFLTEKASAAVSRLAASLRQSEKGGISRRFVTAIGTAGIVTLPTLLDRAEKRYAVTDRFGLGYRFMEMLRDALADMGVRMTVAPSPLIPSRTASILVEGARTLFTVCEDAPSERFHKVINIDRFLSRKIIAERRAKLRFSEKCAASLMDGALSSLAEAGRLHARTEQIYAPFIDFSKVDAAKNRIISEIFENNL